MPEWGDLTSDLERRRIAGRAMGGEERLGRLAAAGRLNARSRVESLLDPGSFAEIGTLAGSGEHAAADGFIAGHGTVDGRPVVVGAEDATVLGGSIGIAGNAKRTRVAHLAGQERVPLVMLLDGAGHRATNALGRRTSAPNDLPALAELAGVVPFIVGVHGASAGHGALAAPFADVVVMVEGAGQLFTAGPPIVEASTGERIGKEELGGWAVAGPAGVAHLVASSDAAATATIRRLLGYLPTNAWAYPPARLGSADSGVGRLEDLIPTDGRRPYDIRPVLERLFDDGSVLELGAPFGTAIVTALARLGGEAVAVVANQPAVRSGSIDRDSADKAARFIEVSGALHLPLVLLADTPGFLPGSAAERSGILRSAGRMFAAQHRHPGPKLHVTLRKAFGFGSSVMGQNPFDGQVVRLALPTATIGAMPAAAAAKAAHADESTAARLAEQEASGPWRLADTLSYDEVVAPGELRGRLTAALRLALFGRRTQAAEPVRHRGSLP